MDPSVQGQVRLYSVKSVAEGLHLIASDSSTRKALVVTTEEAPTGVPVNVFVQRLHRELVDKAVVEAATRYAVGFAAADTTITATLKINQPAVLPPLKHTVSPTP